MRADSRSRAVSEATAKRGAAAGKLEVRLGFDRLFCVLVFDKKRAVDSLGVGLERDVADDLAAIFNSGCRGTACQAVVKPIAIRVLERSLSPSLDRPPRRSG